MSAFLVAIGGKADMTYCGAHYALTQSGHRAVVQGPYFA